MTIKKFDALLYVATICFLCLATASVATAEAPQSGTVPPVKQDDARALLEMAAFEATTKLDRLDLKTGLLRDLVNALITLGDKDMARKILSYQRTLDYSNADHLFGAQVAIIVSQSVHTGDTQAAVDFIQKLPAEYRMDGYEALGKAAAEEGDLNNAMGAIKAVETEISHHTNADRGQRKAEGSTRTYDELRREFLISTIGQALAARGDIAHAISLTSQLSNDWRLFALLGAIAKAQHAPGQQSEGFDTVKAILNALQQPMDDGDGAAHEAAALALAQCGDIKDAQAAVAAIPLPQRRDAATSRISRQLLENGDVIHAQEIEANSPSDVGDLVALGEAQAKKGDATAARASLSAAYKVALQSSNLNHYEQMRLFSDVIDGQIEIGAFTDAIETSKNIDVENRQQYLKRAIAEEVKRKDNHALEETITFAIKTAMESPSKGFTSNGLLGVAEALGKTGYRKAAETVLAWSASAVDSFQGEARIQRLKLISRTQYAIGDNAEAAQTDQKIAQERGTLGDGPTKPENPKLAALNNPKISEALKLIEQSRTENETQAKETLQKALKVLDGNGQALEALMFLPVKTPSREAMSGVDEKIEKHDFSGALAAAQASSGMVRDGMLENVSQAEFKAGDLKATVDTANLIGDDFQRAQTLVSLVRQKSYSH
jgi:hypothetical protein